VCEQLVTANPFEGTAAIKEVSRDRVLTDEELRLLLIAIDRLEWPRRQFFHLLLLTAQRLNEVAAMEWQELTLNGDTPTWVLPAARSKNGRSHTIPLPPAAVEILTGMDRVENSARVFGSFSASHAKTRLDEVLAEVVREEATARGDDSDAATVAPWRLHDLRRTAATTMPRLGVDVVTVYQRHEFAHEKRRALELWAGFLEKLTTERESNVVPLKAEA
jgi:integrase